MNENLANQIRANESERKLRDTQRALATFQKPSKEFLRLNAAERFPNMSKSERDANAVIAHEVVRLSEPVAKRTMSAPALNKTEQRWQESNPLHRPFPMRLRWGQCMWYKPDFLDISCQPSELHRLIEVKGGWIDSRDIVRFKGCAAEWGWLFAFEMWQWKDRAWTRIY